MLFVRKNPYIGHINTKHANMFLRSILSVAALLCLVTPAVLRGAAYADYDQTISEPLEIRINDSLSIRIRSISKEEYETRKQAAEHLRHKPYRKIEDLAKVQKILGRRLKVIPKDYGGRIVKEFEITFDDGTKEYKEYLDLEFVFYAYYPELRILCFDSAGGYSKVDFNTNSEEWNGNISPEEWSVSPDKQLRINADGPDCIARDGYSYFLEKWNKEKRRYEHIGDLFYTENLLRSWTDDGDGLNFERVQHVILCWYYGTDWSWTDNNTVLYTCPDSYTEGGRLYGEMEIIVK
ncbi:MULTISPECIES: hypothetical protein [Alistipes]|nr:MULTISPECIES: hypothetical protein [Alistipes]